MSFDLTVKADDEHSRTADVGRVLAFLAQLPHLRPNGANGYVLDDPPARWMEIDLEFVDPEGNYVDASSDGGRDTNCINFHIPYAFLGDAPERDYFPTALAVAKFLGWRLYDRQSGEDVRAGDIPKRVWSAFNKLVRQALGEG